MGRGQSDIPTDRSHMAASGDARPLRPQSRQDGQQLRDDCHCQDEYGPDAGRKPGECPRSNERCQREWSGQCPTQVVDHLPAGYSGHGIRPSPAARVAVPAEYPGQQLPVAACPAILANRRDQVARREFIEEFYVGHQPGASENALEEVVAQQSVLGHPICHRGTECVDVVDPLAGIAPLLEQVLIDVGDRGRIRVDPGRPGVDSLEDRSSTLGR